MSLELIVLVIVGACVAIWYSRRNSIAQRSFAQPPPELLQPTSADIKSPALSDPFLNEIAEAKRQSAEDIEASTRDYEHKLETRFSDDVRLKERLSQFAREQKLDTALIALWEAVEHRPAEWEGFSAWSKTEHKGEGYYDRGIETVSFSHEGRQYSVSKKAHFVMELGTYADFSLNEDGAEMFAIHCAENYGEYGNSYSHHSVSAFKKRGKWAKLLLQLYSRIQIERNKSSSDSKYFRADKIKDHFEE